MPRLRAGEAESFAAIVVFQNWRASILYVYGPDRKLLYQEVIGDTCQSIEAVPRDGADVDDLLLGGTVTVWKFVATEPEPNQKPGED